MQNINRDVGVKGLPDFRSPLLSPPGSGDNVGGSQRDLRPHRDKGRIPGTRRGLGLIVFSLNYSLGDHGVVRGMGNKNRPGRK